MDTPAFQHLLSLLPRTLRHRSVAQQELTAPHVIIGSVALRDGARESLRAYFLGNHPIERLCRGQTVPFRMLILAFTYHRDNLDTRQYPLGSSE